MTTKQLVKEVVDYYKEQARILPWRISKSQGNYNPYHILVSEIMLQQTQVSRVAVKYQDFITRFPTVQSLAEAPLSEVLVCWQGLGYNRRAKFLHQSAKQLIAQNSGELPQSAEELMQLPGVGFNTAGAILAYAFNKSVSFIETNIRTVFIHCLFPGRQNVSDAALMPYINEALDIATKYVTTREWYWALMDYGTHLKSLHKNPSRSSKHYTKQSAFSGSRRELRGKILRQLATGSADLTQLQETVKSDPRLTGVIEDLTLEGLIHQDGTHYLLGDGILTE